MRGDSITGRLFDLAPAWRDRTAFSSAEGRLSFLELRQGMLAVAGWLRDSAGVGPGDRVAICLPKKLEAIPILYGTHAAGAAYVPLQFDGPPARLAAILNSVEPRLLVTTAEMKARLGAEMGEALPATLVIETAQNGRGLAPLLATAKPAPAVAAIDASDLALIVFTSGSTGEPKGAMLSHHSITVRVTPPFEWDDVLPSDRLIVNTGLHYVGALDVYFPPSRGCTAYLLSDHEAMFADRIVDVMESERTTIWKSSATALRLLTENGHLEGRRLAALRRIDFVGEPLSMDVLRRAMSALPHTAFLHRFGATEAYRIAQYPVPRPLPPDMAELPLGQPGARYRLSLRGDDDRDVAPGERGEICVIGSPVTLGYWKDPVLTAAKRLDGRPNSFRTGDLGRLDKDGLLRWIGRLDQVVKIRGHRVDLGEIEAVLRAHAGVRECAAFAVAGGDGQLEIRVAILPTDADDLDADLRILCIKRLPAHARPASFLALPSFPFLPSGKIDRQALLVRIEGT